MNARNLFRSRSARIEAEAFDWLGRHDAGLSADDARAYAAWLAADPRHARAVAELQALWGVLHQPRIRGREQQALDRLAVIVPRRRRRRQRLQVAVAASGLAVVAALAFLFHIPAESVHPTGTAGVAVSAPGVATRHALPDGSLVQCAPGAEIAPHFTADQRVLRLVRGEAYFSVATDPDRPFIVSVGALSVRAVGTRFAVRYLETALDVIVTEGQVAVARPEGAPSAQAVGPVLLNAGARAVVPLSLDAGDQVKVTTISDDEIASLLSWRGPRLEFSGTPLHEAIAQLNRQNRIQLVLADAAMGNERVSGLFWADDPEAFVRLLESILALEAAPQTGDTIVLRRSRSHD